MYKFDTRGTICVVQTAPLFFIEQNRKGKQEKAAYCGTISVSLTYFPAADVDARQREILFHGDKVRIKTGCEFSLGKSAEGRGRC